MEEHSKGSNNLEECIIQVPCLPLYIAENKTITTADASTKDLVATLWQRKKRQRQTYRICK